MNEGKMATQVIEDVHLLRAIIWLQTTLKSVSTETIKQCFKNCGIDVGDMSVLNEEIDTEFQELFSQVFSETTLDEYIDFDAGTITSEPAIDPIHVDYIRMPRKKHCGDLAIRRYCFNQLLGRRNC